MARYPRLDPDNPDAPVLGVAVTRPVRDRVDALAAKHGVSRSAMMRELIELGLEQLDASLEVAV
jgi:predicted DNA-binding protein